MVVDKSYQSHSSMPLLYPLIKVEYWQSSDCLATSELPLINLWEDSLETSKSASCNSLYLLLSLLPSVDYGNVQTAFATSVLPRVNCWKGGRPNLAEQQHQSLPLLPSVDYGNVQTAIATSVLPCLGSADGKEEHYIHLCRYWFDSLLPSEWDK